MEERYCTNCRNPLPPSADRCEACGYLAGDLFDGRMPKKEKRGGGGVFWTVIVVLACAGGLFWWSWQQQRDAGTATKLPSLRVVKDRPGGARKPDEAAISEAEAIRILRRHFAATGLKSECVAISSQGPKASVYSFTVIDSCERVRLGKFTVDMRSKEIGRP